MSQLDNQENIEKLRKRLYSRGDKFNEVERHGVSDITVDVRRDWVVPETANALDTTPPQKSRRYRWYILLSSFIILMLTAAATGLYMFSGGNQISSQNIEIAITAPNSLGGGERLDGQISVTNQNAVTIDAATLIVTYPDNAQTATEPKESLFERRISIDRLAPGEARNVPIEAIVFGEEGDEKVLQAQLEYRIENSDSLFYKDATPHNFRIISSPVTLEVSSVRQVSAGQEVEVDITLTSNTNQTFENLLVTAQYPEGFTYKSAIPDPDFNQNVWRVTRLNPEESKTITVRGTVAGLADSALRLNVSVGPSLPNNQFIAGATLTDSYTEFVIERPFINVMIEIGGSRENPVVLQAGSNADIRVEVTNTLDEPVYDMVVEAVPTGSALGGASVRSGNGFYNSNRKVVRFDGGTAPELAELRAGETATLNLVIDPASEMGAASFKLAVNVYGRRVGESSAQEQLFGTAEREARYTSDISLAHRVLHVDGPLPPVAGETTTYQVLLTAEAGSNETTNGRVVTRLPVYVSWGENYQAPGTVTFNPVLRELIWELGNISGGQSVDMRFLLKVTPSDSQIGSIPTLVERQIFTASDRFTNSELEAENADFSIEIGSAVATEEGTGIVQSN